MPATKYAASFEYTNAELLALYRECLARISVSGQSYQMNVGGGTREFVGADVKEVMEIVDRLQALVDAEEAATAGTGGAQNLVRFNRAR